MHRSALQKQSAQQISARRATAASRNGASKIARWPQENDRILERLRIWVQNGAPITAPAAPAEPRLSALLKHYIRLHMNAKGKAYVGEEEYRIGRIRARFGALRPSAITLLDVESWVAA